MDLIHSLYSHNPALGTSTVFVIYGVFIVSYAYLYIYLFLIRPKFKKYKEEQKEKEFFNILSHSFENDLFRSFEEFELFYVGFYDVQSEDNSHRKDISLLLKKYISFILANHKENLEVHVIQNKLLKAKAFIEHIENIPPYLELPSVEMNLIKDLESLILDTQTRDIAKQKLFQLANLIDRNHKDLENIKSRSRYNALTNVVSIVMTLISIVLTVFSYIPHHHNISH